MLAITIYPLYIFFVLNEYMICIYHIKIQTYVGKISHFSQRKGVCGLEVPPNSRVPKAPPLRLEGMEQPPPTPRAENKIQESASIQILHKKNRFITKYKEI